MSHKSKLTKTILLLLLLPITLLAVKTIVDLEKSASGIPANITINTNLTQGNLNSSLWQNLSQGGEEATDMINPVLAQTKALLPKLIRVDHIFDHHNVYISDNNYNFSQLDQIVDTILATGAKPMFSISYTPAQMARDGQVASAPTDWGQWQNLVFALAKRYSVDKQINGIYYEVWNEPDLFGGWHYDKDPSYSDLYYHTSLAVKRATLGHKNYKIGGPATTNFYPNWIKALFALCKQKNLELDFISWHQYAKNIDKYSQNIEKLNDILSDYPQFFNIERIVSEFGPNSKPDIWYDNPLSGIHLMSTITQLSGKIHKLFTFEIVDGPQRRANGSAGWGLFTHPSKGGYEKPRAQALKFLNQLQGSLLQSQGDGSWVTSLSSKNQNTIQTLVVNYDPSGKHTETFPVNFLGISPGQYNLKTSTYMSQSSQKTINTTQTLYTEQVYMEPNTAILLELTPIIK